MGLLASARRLGMMGWPSCIFVRLTAIASAGHSDHQATSIRRRRVGPTAGIVCLLIVSLACSTALAVEPKRVILLHSFGRDVKPWSDYAAAIRAELGRQSPWSLEIIDHSVVTARFRDARPQVPLVDYLRALYDDYPVDLIVTIGAPATAFFQRHRQQLFPTVPMVLTAVNQLLVQHSDLTADDAVVAVYNDFAAFFENILRVLPDTANIAVVVGSSPIEKFWEEEIGKAAKPLADRIAFTWYGHLSFEDILKHAAELPPRSVIFWETMAVDAKGVVHDGDTALKRLHAVANAPIFSYQEAFFGGEIVGGPMRSTLEVARQTAAIAVRILGGEKAGDIKTAPIGFVAPKFDWREMQRWGISESRLPPGSEILFRSPTLWQQYRVQALGIIAIVLGQSALIGWLLYEHRHRRRSEAAAHNLSGRLIAAQEEERSRLARELHDDVTQRLAVLAMEAGLEGRKSGGADGAKKNTMRDSLAQLSKDVHALSYRLHPSILEDLGLRDALKSECDHFSQASLLRIDLSADEIPDDVPQVVALCLFRIVQESLRNIGRHASASRAGVRVVRLDRGLQLTVKDNGVGFDPAPDRTRASLGLASMRQRVSLVGGKFRIDSRPLEGTTIWAWVPMSEAVTAPTANVAG
jgi:signal transduction histidine kinase